VNLATTDYSNGSLWQTLPSIQPTDLIPGLSLNSSSSDSHGFGGLFVRNAVRSGVEALIDNYVVEVHGNLAVKANEKAIITANNDSTVTSSGGSMAGEGASVALNAIVATNAVQASARAHVERSSLTATAHGASEGDIEVSTVNSARIRATTASIVEANGHGIGVTLAFNTVGYIPQNFLANLVNVIAGNLLAEKDPVRTFALINGSLVNAAGSVKVDATASGAIDALVTYAGKTLSVTPSGGSSTLNVGATIALNTVATDTVAQINSPLSLATGGDLSVTGSDDSRVIADVQTSSISVGAGTGDSSGVAVGVTWARNELDNNVNAKIDSAGTQAAPATVGGDLWVTTYRRGAIVATTTATAIGLAVSTSGAKAISGGGAIGVNHLAGSANAEIIGSVIHVSGNVDSDGQATISSDDASRTESLVRSIAGSVAVSGGKSPAFALGISIAKNYIGWTTDQTGHDFTDSDTAAAVDQNEKVLLTAGPLQGNVYKFVGQSIFHFGAPDVIDLTKENYEDRNRWKLASIRATEYSTLAAVDATVLNVADDLNVTATSVSTIDATVLAGAVAIGVGSQSSFGGSIAGVVSVNTIESSVRASITNTPVIVAAPTEPAIVADSIHVIADDASRIGSVAGAASIAASVTGQSGIAGSIGLSLAFNDLTGGAAALMTDNGIVETRTGDLYVSSISRAAPLFDFSLATNSLSASQLDDAAKQDDDNGDTVAIDEAAVDAAADKIILNHLADALRAGGEKLPTADTLRGGWTYTTGDGVKSIQSGQTVRLEAGYRLGGVGGDRYEYIGATVSRDLGTQDYSNSSVWRRVDPELKLSILEPGKSWLLVTGDGSSYTLKLSAADASKLEVSKSSISAVSVAASMGIGIGGQSGIALSGAGAVAINSVQTQAEAIVDRSAVTVAGKMNVS
ncbi:MAG TPA: hypothetical protein DDZ51_19050, partial [Planctomycetaceae bacterium]|nr:hypothetical protein [Planctomycetaceae bacterium]